MKVRSLGGFDFRAIVTSRLKTDGFRQGEICRDLASPAEIALVLDGDLFVEDALSRDDGAHVEDASLQSIGVKVDVVGEVHHFEIILHDQLQTAGVGGGEIGAGAPHGFVVDPSVLLDKVLGGLVVDGGHEGMFFEVQQITEFG